MSIALNSLLDDEMKRSANEITWRKYVSFHPSPHTEPWCNSC